MAWSNCRCDGVSQLFSLRKRSEKVARLVAATILTFFPTVAFAIDVSPLTQQSESDAPTPDMIPKRPSESRTPPSPPPPIDPGILHVPEKRGDPRGSVQPPNVDPNMPTNPDVMPGPREGINPPDGANPQKKPGAR